MNLEGEKLCEFVRAQQAVDRDERIRIRQEKKEDEERIDAKAEKERIAAIEDEERIAAKAEKERIAATEEAVRMAEEAERIRQHENDVLRIQVEADRIRSQETSMSREMNDSAYRPRNSGRSPKLPVFSEGKDDMDAYLQRFERYAEHEGWDANCYGTYLGSLLSGKALEVYSRLPNSEASEYYQLKEALLIHYQLTQEDYRKKFHSGTQTSMETAAQYLARLEFFFDNWIRLSKIEESFEGLRELILVEKYLHSCPRELALFIRERSPSDMRHLLELAKIFTSARAAVGGSVKPHQPNRDTDPSSNSQPIPNRPNTGPNWNQHPGRGLCYLCQKPGHRMAACPTGKPLRYDDRMRQPVHGNAACLIEDEDEYSFPVIGGGSVLEKDNLPLMKGFIGDQEVTVLRDTGSTGVMVKADLVHPSQLTGRNRMLKMVTSRLEEYPVAWIQVDTPVFSGYLQALCLPDPICDLVIGNIPGVHPNILGDVMKTAEMQHVEVEKIEEKVIQHEEAEKTAVEEMQHVKVMKTADEEMQLEMVTPDSVTSYYEVTQSKSEGDGVNVELITCADIAESVQVGHATKDGEDASGQEAEHHTTDYEDGRMSKEQERSDIEHGIALEEEKLHREVELKRRSNLEQPALESETRIEAKVTDHNTRLVTDHHIGQLRRPSFHDPLDMRSSKVPEDRSRFSSRREHSPKRSSVERNGRVDGRRRSPHSKTRRYSSWARKKADGRDVDENGGYSRDRITLSDSQTLYGPLDRIDVKGTIIEKEANKMMTMGIIEPSKSPFLFSPLLIKKADG